MNKWNLQKIGYEKGQKMETMAKLFPNLMKTVIHKAKTQRRHKIMMYTH